MTVKKPKNTVGNMQGFHQAGSSLRGLFPLSLESAIPGPKSQEESLQIMHLLYK